MRSNDHSSPNRPPSPRSADGSDEHPTPTGDATGFSILRLVRTGITGVLMGLANLVPGVSGGTMVLIMGLYDEFVSSVADVTRLRFTKRNVVFLGVLGIFVVATIASLAEPTKSLVTNHRTAMYALFIGMTLGGAPMLWRMLQPVRPASGVLIVVGIGLMVAIAAASPDRPDDEAAVKETTDRVVDSPDRPVEPSYARDVLAGVLGMSAMVLPGISGAYMLLILGRYLDILDAIHLLKEYATSGGQQGDLGGLHVLIPVAIGAVLSLVSVSNLLKWLLRAYPKPTLGLLLGILLGSVVGLWPFDDRTTDGDYAIAGALLAGGFVFTALLSRIGRQKPTSN